MINIDKYIFEKLHINKDIKLNPHQEVPSEEDFLELLSKSGEVYLSDIFKKKEIPCDEKHRDILSIYTQNIDGEDEMYYSFQEKGVNYEQESELYLDVFSDEQIIKIYDYMSNL